MLFPTHLAAAYTISKHTSTDALAVITGAALPDILDKSLAAQGVTTLYHTFGHSIYTVMAAIPFLRESQRGRGILLGWMSHLLLDGIQMIINGRASDVQFLFWPSIQHVPEVFLPPIRFSKHYIGTPAFYTEIGIWVTAILTFVTRS
ncbi:hypothetical protein K0C01_11320 [Salinarchaeum sp. IM2453]|uniref:hypothetical protein n=1 Tax=Salinarchaeum sp. IM2453 TaxID=2862870 RepID=UPI001C82E425|nr:hypothetical protein [Salinarchaeum sp. IM2453]QZA88361.1 hypothetical protein K0C01_11320 [Salinarchaeum sp. IM2453]